jgi:DNA-directed RNA polymerase specialized sigma subunit
LGDLKKKNMTIEYLNNKTFETIISRYKLAKKNEVADPLEFEIAQTDLAEAFNILAKNIIRAFRFQLVDKDDALQEGIMICFEKLHRFNPEKGRAFNFCTTIILNHYRQLYRTAKNYNELKIKYHEHLCEKVNETFISALKSRKKTSSYKRHESNDSENA